jgi:ABC-type bacteriocin/lantibiotic exporter with double-glycine peptidase domain
MWNIIQAIASTVDATMATLMTFINVVFFIGFSKTPLIPSYTVYAIGFYMRLSSSIGFMFTRACTSVSNIRVGFKRVNDFLLADELFDKREKLVGGEVAVNVDKLNFRWKKDEGFGLRDISMKINKGEFVAIVGPVGSGKVVIKCFIIKKSRFIIY